MKDVLAAALRTSRLVRGRLGSGTLEPQPQPVLTFILGPKTLNSYLHNFQEPCSQVRGQAVCAALAKSGIDFLTDAVSRGQGSVIPM